MAIELTPLETLPPTVERIAGAAAPPTMRLMAARGMAPLPPPDLAVALYQLQFAEDDVVRDGALRSAAELPDPILQSALAAPLDARVLDFFGRRITQRPKLLSILLLNKAAHDETFRHLATLLKEAELEIIAKNEERLLRCPSIIAALYLNAKTRMSTAQRIIELAVRNNVRVDGIPAFDEAAKAIGQSTTTPEEDDAAFRAAAAIAVDDTAILGIITLTDEPPVEVAAEDAGEVPDAAAEAAEAIAEAAAPGNEDEKAKKLTELSPAAKIRVATLGNAFSRSVLIRDKNKQVSMACIRSPGVSDSEAMKYAANRSLDDDIIRFVANHRQWTRVPGIRLALVNNPKTPLPISMKLLAVLNVRDLRGIARSKGIASALAKAAKTLVAAKGG